MTEILSLSENNGIGKDNSLLFHIPEDMIFFRQTTLNKTVVMGRKTLESFPNGKPLPKRRNIVLSRGMENRDDIDIVRNTDELFSLIKDIPTDELFVIGGAEIYKLLLPYCDKLLITHVNASPDADSFFPAISPDIWKKTYESEEKEYEGLKYRFTTYERIR